MAGHGYETGRLDLPFTGICSFARRPFQPDWAALSADVAVLGAPYDAGTQWRAGARFGPRAVREASTLFSFGHAGAYDHEDDVTYLGPDCRIVDMGDADIVHTDTEASHRNIEAGIRAARVAGALPVLIGATIRSTSPRSGPATMPARSICCRSTPISISSTNATASGTAMATRCAAPPNSPLSAG
jgi:hypothetical protein